MVEGRQRRKQRWRCRKRRERRCRGRRRRSRRGRRFLRIWVGEGRHRLEVRGRVFVRVLRLYWRGLNLYDGCIGEVPWTRDEGGWNQPAEAIDVSGSKVTERKTDHVAAQTTPLPWFCCLIMLNSVSTKEEM